MMTDAPDITRPPRRLGPRPLALHLGLATTSVASSFATLPLREQGRIDLPVPLPAELEEIARRAALDGAPAHLDALAAQGRSLVEEMIEGIRRYHAHPYRRADPARPVLWQNGTTTLLDGAPSAPATAPIVLLVPSLVNPSYVLDLMPGRSFVDYLAARGLHPLMVDWNAPGEAERGFDTSAYVSRRIIPMLDFAAGRYPEAPLHLAGYCMGGTLGLAAAIRRQSRIKSLIAIATPWDFHAGYEADARGLLDQSDFWASILNGFGELPVDLLQTLFVSLDPGLGLRKFGRFARMDMRSDEAREFVAIEDWLNEGHPLPRGVAEDVLNGWYARNEPVQNQWMVDGIAVRAQDMTMPSLIAVPETDRIVPRLSALALAEALPRSTVITSPSGHVGMMAGRQASSGLWRQAADWIATS